MRKWLQNRKRPKHHASDLLRQEPPSSPLLPVKAANGSKRHTHYRTHKYAQISNYVGTGESGSCDAPSENANAISTPCYVELATYHRGAQNAPTGLKTPCRPPYKLALVPNPHLTIAKVHLFDSPPTTEITSWNPPPPPIALPTNYYVADTEDGKDDDDVWSISSCSDSTADNNTEYDEDEVTSSSFVSADSSNDDDEHSNIACPMSPQLSTNNWVAVKQRMPLSSHMRMLNSMVLGAMKTMDCADHLQPLNPPLFGTASSSSSGNDDDDAPLWVASYHPNHSMAPCRVDGGGSNYASCHHQTPPPPERHIMSLEEENNIKQTCAYLSSSDNDDDDYDDAEYGGDTVECCGRAYSGQAREACTCCVLIGGGIICVFGVL